MSVRQAEFDGLTRKVKAVFRLALIVVIYLAMMAGEGPVTPGGYAEIIDEFSKCWGYLEHLGKVAKDASILMEGTMVEGYQYSMEEGNGMDVSKEGIKNKKWTADWNRGVDIRNGNEKSQVNLIATLVEKIMKDYRKDSNEPKVGIRCNFYNRGFSRQLMRI